jgi:NAD(P)-dependent dehydrogenase (short-subunit alcohol dehydrogenase family)
MTGVTRTRAHPWQFRARFRRHAFGWKSQPAVQRVREAVSEIKQVTRTDRILAADGAVTLLERLSPALEHVDSSSGAIGTAVNNAIAELVPIIANAPADDRTREAWLQRLWVAHEADQMPYIEILADHWGELCASKEVASVWADELISATRLALSPDRSLRGHFHGTSACLSALHRAERYEEIVDILQVDTIWAYKRWAVKALSAMGMKSEAIRHAESCRGPWTHDADVDAVCEQILLSSGLVDDAYQRYGLRANRRSTYLATFRAVAKKYPHRMPREILDDLVETTPGEEGKWFAAAKDAGLYDEALALARLAPCDPRTLTRTARDLAEAQPDFAVGVGLLALHWLIQGYGFEISSADVWAAYSSTMTAAERRGDLADVRERVRRLVAGQGSGGFVARILSSELGL